MINTRRMKVLGLLGLPLIAIAMLAVFLSWSLSSDNKASADVAAHGGLDFHIGIDTNQDTTDDCSSEGTLKCNGSVGSSMNVNLYLDDLGDIPDYEAYDTIGSYSPADGSVVDPKEDWLPADDEAGVTAFSCDTPAQNFGSPGQFATSCTSDNAINPSFEGFLGTMTFNCAGKGEGTVDLLYGDGNTGPTSAGTFHSPDGDEAALTVNCLNATATPTSTPTATPPPVPRMQKLDNDGADCPKPPDPKPTTGPCAPGLDPNGDNLSSLFLQRSGAKIPPAPTCRDNNAKNVAIFEERINIPIPLLPDPKDPNEDQQLGAFEFEVHYNEDKICVSLVPGPDWDDNLCFIIDDSGTHPQEGIASIGCVTQGKDDFPDTTTDDGKHLADVIVKPQPDTFSQLRPNQENGLALQLNNIGCELSDLQGHAIEIFSCEDADVTIRYLEGDVAGPDCSVDAMDTQAMAFRYGVKKGNLNYSLWYDMEPSGGNGQANGDGDVDIKDLQFVFGRFGSNCANQWPAQPPVNPKL